MAAILTYFKARFWRDDKGRVVLWQVPNGLLLAWIVLSLLAMVLSSSRFKNYVTGLATVMLFGWAGWELASGVNIFRRILGFVVLVVIIMGHI